MTASVVGVTVPQSAGEDMGADYARRGASGVSVVTHGLQLVGLDARQHDGGSRSSEVEADRATAPTLGAPASLC